MSPNPDESRSLTLFTVGHSNYPAEVFLELLDRHEIEVVVDVRSNPYSRYAQHFHGPLIRKILAEHGIKYVFLGHVLGGKPKEAEFYDDEGHVDYARLAASKKFKEGMERLERGMHVYRVALMCGEEDPSGCHRHLLIARLAARKGYFVKHIRKGGQIQDYESLLAAAENPARQLSLFAPQDDERTAEDSWRSQSPVKKDPPE